MLGDRQKVPSETRRNNVTAALSCVAAAIVPAATSSPLSA
jgi:hypothetical protein